MTAKLKRKRTKFTGGAKVTLAALSVISFVGGWDLIARLDWQEAQASPSEAASTANQLPRPTPRPTIAPLTNLPPIPTLPPTQTADLSQPVQMDSAAASEVSAPVPTLTPLPDLAPLPPMPELPPLPPSPVQTWNGGNGNHSGGS